MSRLTTHHGIESRPLETLLELLQSNAAAIGDQLAFRFVRGNQEEEQSLTFRSLHDRALAIGEEIRSVVAEGDRALLLYPPGLEFVTAFFGCIATGVVAVPVAMPARNRPTSIEAIAKASKATAVLSTAEYCERNTRDDSRRPLLPGLPWIPTDRVEDDRYTGWYDPQVEGGQPAFLQYTSGSTSSPKGVIVRHENVMANAELIKNAFGNTAETRGVIWLPHYHDMGLIGGILQPIYYGGSCTLMPPASFLQRPRLWLETISMTGGTVSGGPDFAYQMCVEKISEEERAGLDLSSWQVAFTGAERVRAETIRRFTEAFAPCGFRPEAFFPCYGLAEATLIVSGGPWQVAPATLRVASDEMGRNQVREVAADDTNALTFVGSGECLPGQDVVIVDRESRLQCAADDVGEIWVQGSSVTDGYFDQVEATKSVFHCYLADTGAGPYLRTGDLGFIHNGQLYVTGRSKDVIIIRGRNYYPEDVEHFVSGAHPAFRVGGCSAFGIQVGDEERLVVVQELAQRRNKDDADEMLRAIRRAVAAELDLEIYGAVIVRSREIPKTSSGKMQRSVCRERYLNQELRTIAEWTARPVTAGNSEVAIPVDISANPRSRSEIEDWLIATIAARVDLEASRVQVTTPFLEFGIGSLETVQIAAELQEWLGRPISPTSIYNYPNIGSLASHLADSGRDSRSQDATRVHGRQDAATFEGIATQEVSVDDVRNLSEDDIKAMIMDEMSRQ